ncbi:MAG: response regulator [Nitrospira sp.]
MQLPAQVCPVPTNHVMPSARPTLQPAPDQPKPSQPSPLTILLVEDMEDNRVLVSVLLKALPYRLELAEQGAAGVEKFQSGRYDLVLMDIQMPVMDGYEAIRLMRRWEKQQQRCETPILALTGNTHEDDIEKAQAAGFTAHVTKPLKKTTLLEAIQRYATPSSGKESAA